MMRHLDSLTDKKLHMQDMSAKRNFAGTAAYGAVSAHLPLLLMCSRLRNQISSEPPVSHSPSQVGWVAQGKGDPPSGYFVQHCAQAEDVTRSCAHFCEVHAMVEGLSCLQGTVLQGDRVQTNSPCMKTAATYYAE